MESSIIDMFSVLIVQNHRSLQKLYSEALVDTGLKISYVACLMILRHNIGGCSASDMRRATCYDKALISRMLTELTERGLVCKNPEDEKKRRGARFILTDEGLTLTKSIDRLSHDISERITRNISKSELEAFYLTGAQLTDNLKKLAEEQTKEDKICLN